MRWFRPWERAGVCLVAGQRLIPLLGARVGTWKRRLAPWRFYVKDHISSAFANEVGLTVRWKGCRVIGHNEES